MTKYPKTIPFPMSEGSEENDLPEDPSFQLWMDFENVCDRYISLVDDQLASIPQAERAKRMERTYLERTIILASRRDVRTFRLLSERVRQKAWSGPDRVALSRYVSLLALFPSVFDDIRNMPTGATAASMKEELARLAIAHPYLFNESWSAEAEQHQGLMEDFIEMKDSDYWDEEDAADLEAENDGLLGIQEIDPGFLEQAIAILDTIRGACEMFAAEGHPDLSSGALEIIRTKEYRIFNMLARFVVECMFLRLLRSADPKEDVELMRTWQGGIELGRVEIDVTPASLDRTMVLLVQLHGSEAVARGLLIQAAESSADLIGKKALTMMSYATSVPTGDAMWPSYMHDLVMLQMVLNIDPDENIRRMAEQGRREGRPSLLVATEILRAIWLEDRGLRDKASKARLELVELIKRHKDDPDVLIQIPEATDLLLGNKERPAAKKILEVGLKATASKPAMAALRTALEEAYHQL
jgi:hypothetical protein